ncbi:unnamed protein product [Echinostoma caproni]|uniref:Uncharacterized protein n=1 Tax=Echinostoma caproni TaxID=27848 RepID=A0A3P8GX36_9TREM|nr:unnamed protein product [Echinostoma caproni]
MSVPDRMRSVGTPPSVVVSPLLQNEDGGSENKIGRSTSSEPRAGTANRSFSFTDYAPAGHLSADENDVTADTSSQPFLTDYRRLRAGNQPIHLFVMHPKHEDTIRLDPGINKITLVSQSPGFLVPGDIRISVLSRISKNRPSTTKNESESSDTTLHLVSRVQAKHFDSTWSSPKLLDSLLPTVHYYGQMEIMRPLRVILGLRHSIDLQLELRKLGLPVPLETGIGLYRIVHRLNAKAPGPLSPTDVPARVPKVVNDYRVSPLFKDTNSNQAGESQSTKSRFTTVAQLSPNDYRCDLQDGPVQLDSTAELIPIDATGSLNGETAPANRTRFRLSRPLWIRALADKDEVRF